MIKTPALLSPIRIGKSKFDFASPYIMGILNLTPDSFSDGGKYQTVDTAFPQIEKMIQDGADIIDIGAESTRPGATEVPPEIEWQRLEPILQKYRSYFDTPLSLDTRHALTAKKGIELGVDVINDISGLLDDPQMAKTVGKKNIPVILMHKQGVPQTMQENPQYQNNILEDILSQLQISIEIANKNHISTIIIDPGIGFGKTRSHNLTIIRELHQLKQLGFPILIGCSNKSFIGDITGSDIHHRLPGTLSAHLISILNGAHFVRVHDVAETKQSIDIMKAIFQ